MPAIIQFNSINCIQPTQEVRAILSGRRDGARPNMFKTQWGRMPGYGWFLLAKKDFDSISLNNNDHSVAFATGTGAEEQHTISNLYITHYESVYGLTHADGNDLVLVKVEDGRCIGDFTYLNESYNIRKRTEGTDANATARYYSTAGNAFQDVTGIINDMWTSGSMSTYYGTLTEDIDAGHDELEWIENLHYRGVSALDSVIDCARRGALEFTLDLDGEGVLFAPNELNTTTIDTQTDLYTDFLLKSSSAQSSDVTKYPEKIEVHFRKSFADPVANTDTSVYSPEEDQYFNPFYIKEITTTSIDSSLVTITGTKMVLHHDKVMLAEDSAGNKTTNFDPLATDIATNWINSRKNTDRKLSNLYSGAHPFPHQVFNEIVWFDFGEGIMTSVKLDLPDPRPSNADYKDEQRITWGFGQTKVDIDAYSGTTADSGTLKPINHNGSGTVDESSTKSLTAYYYGHTPLETGTNVFWIQDPSSQTPILFPAGGGGYKPLVRFTLNAALATTDASKAATITNQYGPGKDNSTSITVHNLETSTASTYVFEGDSGDAGLAIHDSGTNYRIIQMECP